MIIKRIVPNLSARDLSKARQFYGVILGLQTALGSRARLCVTSNRSALRISEATVEDGKVKVYRINKISFVLE